MNLKMTEVLISHVLTIESVFFTNNNFSPSLFFFSFSLCSLLAAKQRKDIGHIIQTQNVVLLSIITQIKLRQGMKMYQNEFGFFFMNNFTI